MAKLDITLEVKSNSPAQDKYFGLLSWLGIDQQQYEIIRAIPKLEEMRKFAHQEYLDENQVHDD